MKGVIRLTATSLSLCLLLLSTMALARQAEGKRGVTPEDYFAFEFVSDPRISPDGRLVAYVVATADQKQNRRHSSIWMTAGDGSRTPWQFTTSPQNSNSPRWSPNGQWLAFISSRPSTEAARTTNESAASDQRSQVCVLSMDGGEARRITNLKNGASNFQWSPDGKRLVCLSRTGPSDSRAENRDRSDVRHYSHISYMFKAAVTLRSLSNFISDDGTRDGATVTNVISAATSLRNSICSGTARRSSMRRTSKRRR